MKDILETREVTQKTYCRAETDRTFYNASQLTGGVNSMFSFRNVTPLDRQTVVRMNKDTLYTVALVDTSKGATITVPEMPAGRYFSVLLLDNDHYGLSSRFGSLRTPVAAKCLIFIVSPAADFRAQPGACAKRQLPDFFDGALPLSYVKFLSLTAPRSALADFSAHGQKSSNP